MASGKMVSVVAVVGIAAASAVAWWYQSQPRGPTEIVGSIAGTAAASAAAGPSGRGTAVPSVGSSSAAFFNGPASSTLPLGSATATWL